MFEADVESVEPGRVTRYSILREGKQLSFAETLELWRTNDEFRGFYTTLLSDSPFDAFRWETPPLDEATIDHPFEFVLLESGWFCSRKTDTKTYRKYFSKDDSNAGLVSFKNLSGDATLIVPSPRTDQDAYGHLASFIRQAPEEQHQAFWRVIAETVLASIGERTLWLNTAGGGVAWLHVRLDSRPKYYGYAPYKRVDR